MGFMRIYDGITPITMVYIVLLKPMVTWGSNLHLTTVTLWLLNIAMEHGPFLDGLPINGMVIFHGYVSHNQMVGIMV